MYRILTRGLRLDFWLKRASVTLALIVLTHLPAHAQIGSDRYASIVIDARSGEVISAVAPDAPRYPASLTKAMTAFMVFDAVAAGRSRWTDRVTMSRTAAAAVPSKLGLPPGSTLTLEQALLAIVTRSANDVAVAIAEHLGGSEPAFARMMTLKARQIGMRDTTFRNASGLPDREQISTARDMATLGRRLIADHPRHYHYFSTEAFRFRGRVHRSHNRVLASYDGADGIKTGYIRDSGFNLLTSAQRDGRRVVAVVFGGASGAERDRHMVSLLDNAFGNETRVAGAKPPVTLVSRAQAAPSQQAMRNVETQAVRGRAGPAADWAVQVGAFRNRGQALSAARSAEARIGIARAETAVRPISTRKRQLFRAQVTNLTAAEARAACAARAKLKQACMTIAPSREASSRRTRG